MIRSARIDKRKWMRDIAEIAKDAAKKGDLRQLYQTTRTLAERKTLRNRPLRTKQGDLITKKNDIMRKQIEHYREILGERANLNDGDNSRNQEDADLTENTFTNTEYIKYCPERR